MTEQTFVDWTDANQRYMVALLNEIKAEIRLNLHQQPGDELYKSLQVAHQSVADMEAAMPAPAAINELTRVLNLSLFERKIVLVCAGVELDDELSQLMLEFNQNSQLPTFRMALLALSNAHWSALSPISPLRYWRLVEMEEGELIANSPIKIDEQILHYLTGISYLDQRLAELLETVNDEDPLVPSQEALSAFICDNCLQADGTSILIQLLGSETADKRAVAKAAASKTGLQLYAINASMLPSGKSLNEFVRIWNRESALNDLALFVDCSENDHSDRAARRSLNILAENIQSLILISTAGTSLNLRRQQLVLNVNKPTAKEQLELWRSTIKPELNYTEKDLGKIVSQFNMSARDIRATAAQAAGLHGRNGHPELNGNAIWNICCAETRPRINELAERVIPVAKWDDLVIPQAQREILKEIAIHVQQRNKVYDDWGFAEVSSRGLGISVLFHGDSGTGKTMASEVLANELKLDLYRIDLSQVVNKYIGETEKNLKKIFDAAEDGGSILLFDEADALFGRRSEVKDSHDRYGNIEVSYLLQRMESYRGLAILTTNMKNALDAAFLRRLRFVVQFPFPDISQRMEIWKRVFPNKTPTLDLDVEKLARLNVAGGNIKNIAMNASFIAANDGQPVQMGHISRAARSEYSKLEKMLSGSEINYW